MKLIEHGQEKRDCPKCGVVVMPAGVTKCACGGRTYRIYQAPETPVGNELLEGLVELMTKHNIEELTVEEINDAMQ